MTHGADPVRSPDVVFAAGLADAGLAHLAEGTPVHDPTELGAASAARPCRIRRPKWRGAMASSGPVVHLKGPFLLQHGELGFKTAENEKREKNVWFKLI